jgi:hypothetical protein
MELTYQQVLAEVYDENSKNVLVHHVEYDDDNKDPYEKYDYDDNKLEDLDEFNKFHGDRNKPEHVVNFGAKEYLDGKLGVKYQTDIRTIVLNIDGAFRGNIVPKQPVNCNGLSNEAVNPGTLSSNFIFNTNRLYKNIRSVKMTSMEFSNSFYTFSAKRGNTIFYITLPSDLTTKYTITIPDGNYLDYTIFANAVQSALNTPTPSYAVTLAFTVTYEPISHTIIIAEPSNGFIITFPNTETNPYGNGIGYNMGFLNTTYSATLSPTFGDYRVASDQAPNIFQDTYVYLQINDWNLVEHQVYGQTYYSVFAKIQLNSAKNTIIYDNNYSNSSTKEYVFHQPVNISRLEIRILDAYGNTLDLRSSNFSMTLELQEVNQSSVYEKLLEL